MTTATMLSVYIFLIALFYIKTDGFQEEHSLRFCMLKTLPVLALGFFVHRGHGALKGWDRANHAAGLAFGALGDFLIALYEGGLVTGAIAFAMGHLCYMARFAPSLKKLSQELTVITVTYFLFVNHFFLLPQLPIKPLTTIIIMAYALVLATAWVVSGSLYIHGTQKQPPFQSNNLMRFIGYSLFLLSDSLILLDEVGIAVPYVRISILSTYYAAQYVILRGSLRTAQLA
jgi:uncharacterized membrane protein YhhN